MKQITDSERLVLEAIDGLNGAYSNGDPKPLAQDEIPERASTTMWGTKVPGRTLWNRLEKAGLFFFPIEDPITLDNGDPFVFSSFAELSDKGREALRTGVYDPTPPID